VPPAVTAAPEIYGSSVCLTNSDSYCLGISGQDIIDGIIGAGAYDAIKYIAQVIIDYIGGDPKKDDDPEDEIEGDAPQDGEDTELCLTDTGLSTGRDADWGPCGANGTVWTWVPHGDGYYLYSRFAENNGVSLVLTIDPLSNGSKIYVASPANSGGPYWQTFTHYVPV
jgi:hypothetical protein